MNSLGTILTAMGNADAARRSLERSLSIFQQLNSHALVSTAKVNLGSLLLELGDIQSARQNLEEALAGFQVDGNSYGIEAALKGRALLLRETGDLARALADAKQALKLAEEARLGGEIAEDKVVLATIYWEQGKRPLPWNYSKRPLIGHLPRVPDACCPLFG